MKIAYYLPKKIVTNAELAALYSGWAEEKILAKTGIASRHVAGDNETAADMAVEAAKKLFPEHGMNAAEIGFILLQCFFCKLMEWFVNAWPNRKIFNFSFFTQINILMPMFLSVTIMAVAVLGVDVVLQSVGVSSLAFGDIVTRLVVKIPVGIVTYVGVSRLLRVSALKEYCLIAISRVEGRNRAVVTLLKQLGGC